MKIVLIAAIGSNDELGLNNKLLWKSPSDLARFKELTEGYPIIMGRNTFESLPGILPNRKHFIITSSLILPEQEDLPVSWSESLQDSLEYCKDGGYKQAFIIGGASIYKQALEQDLVDELLITHMDWEGEADKFFKPDLSNWQCVDTLASYSGEQGPSWVQKQYIRN